MGAICRLLEGRATWKKGGDPRTPQYWLKKLFGAQETITGIKIDEDKALTYSAVWAAVNIISGAIGFLPMIVYKRGSDGESKERQPKHPIYRLLHDRPNEYMDALTFRETLQGHILTWGNAYAEIERDGAARPIALWPLLPNRTEPKVNNGRLWYKVTHKDGSTNNLTNEKVLHIKGLGFDGIRGYSVIDYAGNSISIGMAAEKYGGKFFANNSNPGGFLKHPKHLSKEAGDRLLERMEETHKGLDNVHRLAILEEGMDWQQTGIAPDDAQLLETRKFSVTEVARWFDVPVHMLKELDKATFNNIEHQGIEFVIWTLLKWIRRWELECNYKLFRNDDQGTYFTEILVDALLRGDAKTRYEGYRIGRMAGFLSINDIRKKENMNPVEHGDTYLEPLNMKPVGTPFVLPAQKFSKNVNRRELLETTWQRLITKEINAIRKTAKKNDSFKSRMDNFYRKYLDHMTIVLQPVIKVCGDNDQDGIDTRKLAEGYVTEHRNRITSLMDSSNGDDVQDALEETLMTWEIEEALRMTDNILKEN